MNNDDDASKQYTDALFVNNLLEKESLANLALFRNQSSVHSRRMQEHLADLQPLGEMREHLADLQPLGGIREHLTDLQPLGGIREHLDELQTLGVMSEQLADLQPLGVMHEQLANLQHLGGTREQLADLQHLGGIREQLANLQHLGGMREQLADLQPLGVMREQLANLQHLGGMREQLADLQHLGGIREQLADLQHLGGMREHLSELQALTTVHEWASVTGFRQHLEDINFETGFTGLKQRLADLNGVAGINWSARLAELQTLSPIIDGLSATSGIPFDDSMFRAAYEVATYAGLHQHNEGLKGVNQSSFVREPQANCQANKFSDLPLQLQKFVLKFMYDLLIALVASLTVLAIQERYFAKIESYNELSSPREIRKLTRCDNSWDREALSQCRLVSGYNVKLRSKPNQKSYELATLPLGATLRILDTYNRSWLKVEIVSEDITVEGWVLRRYTEYFR
ncbi:SH3 domain-containing protein [Halomonas alkaliantarctica]|uniref:SH3 domain-containing protein n=1 Tax=Halomonas alkaliantarctica TaxID=232346 RepID=A0ABY8LIF0_9GAMM|nr:SH3 domain-containing protein [Halomonas alkaliantarctica]WGI23616.1 SH3 domain-containing protein [Halomonas alkaliantarctica]